MRRLSSRLVAALLWAAATTCSAADYGSLHQFNGTFDFKQRVRLILHSRFRTDNHLSNYSQFRFGPIVTWDWTERVQLQSGAYFLRQDVGEGNVTQYRLWGGAQFRLVERDNWIVDWRNLLERHFVEGSPNFIRVRSRGLVSYTRRRWQPFASAEVLGQQGHALARYGTGINYLWKGHLFSLGYEYRGNINKPGLHLITTIVQFRLKGQESKRAPGDPSPPQ